MSGKHITARYQPDSRTLTIAVSGVFNFDHISEFRNAYWDLEPSPEHVIVDLRETESIDSAALGILLNMQEKLGLGRDAIRLTNLADDVRRILEITRFDLKFSIE